jgi:RimJ/RimL family protein N-acetyltransferase
MIPFSLHAPGLVLDPPHDDDSERIYEYCQDPLFRDVLNTPWPYSRTDASYFVGTLVPHGWERGSELTWALRAALDQPLMGVISLRMGENSRAEVGFWLGADHRGRGYMPAAVGSVADWAFTDGGIAIIAWECRVGNAASLTVARKTGFTFTGTGPASLPSRDGSHPASWKGELTSTGERTEKHGWPAL